MSRERELLQRCLDDLDWHCLDETDWRYSKHRVDLHDEMEEVLAQEKKQ